MYSEKHNITYVPTPRTGSTSILRHLLELPHEASFLRSGDLPYSDQRRHPTLKTIGIQGQVVISVRCPIERFKSIKRWSGRLSRSKSKLNKFGIIPANEVHMLARGYDYLIGDYQGDVTIIRQETFATDESDFEKVFREKLGYSNKSPEGLDDLALSDYELHMVKMLNPWEWNLYDCDRKV